jgi:hypothetical protein
MDQCSRGAAAPPGFGIEFLDWFRDATEKNWAAWQSQYFAGTEYRAFGSAPWQKHAHWLRGLSHEAIYTLERTWSVAFPPDWRVFLSRIHAADRPVPGVSPTTETSDVARPFFEWFPFYNWTMDSEELRAAFAWPLDGLLFDIEHNDFWHASWGTRYPDLRDRKRRIIELVAQAPMLIPIMGHRYLVAEPCCAGNPVLSVYQSDIIVYGGDLRTYFLAEFTYFLSLGRDALRMDGADASWRAIPFWGEFL